LATQAAPAFGQSTQVGPMANGMTNGLAQPKPQDAPLLDLSSEDLTKMLVARIRDEWAVKIVRAVLDAATSQGLTQIGQVTDHVISQLATMARVTATPGLVGGSVPNPPGVSSFLASQPGLMAPIAAKASGRRVSAKKIDASTPVCQCMVKRKEGTTTMCGSAAVEGSAWLMCQKHCNVKSAADQFNKMRANGAQPMTKAVFDSINGSINPMGNQAGFRTQGGIAPQPQQEETFNLDPLPEIDMFISSGSWPGVLMAKKEDKFQVYGVGNIETSPSGDVQLHVIPLPSGYRNKLESAAQLKQLLIIPAIDDPHIPAVLDEVKKRLADFIQAVNAKIATDPKAQGVLTMVLTTLQQAELKIKTPVPTPPQVFMSHQNFQTQPMGQPSGVSHSLIHAQPSFQTQPMGQPSGMAQSLIQTQPMGQPSGMAQSLIHAQPSFQTQPMGQPNGMAQSLIHGQPSFQTQPMGQPSGMAQSLIQTQPIGQPTLTNNSLVGPTLSGSTSLVPAKAPSGAKAALPLAVGSGSTVSADPTEIRAMGTVASIRLAGITAPSVPVDDDDDEFGEGDNE